MSNLAFDTGVATAETDREIATRLFSQIAARTADTEGVSRPAFSAIETETLEYLAAFAASHGLATWYDAGQNLMMSLPEDADAPRAVIVGSHVDSVPYGGNFDGLAGVVAGMVCLVRARREGRRFARPVKVLAMRGEESAWFGPCYIGSKALTGTLSPAELAAKHKADGRTLASHMADIGIDMEPVAHGRPLADPASMEAYIELHIEQGPLLVGREKPAAVVSGIRGNVRHRRIVCHGEAGHSGAVPKAFRKDPVLALADLLVRLDESWTTILNKGGDLVLTSGMLGTDPGRHAMSRIPDLVFFSLDIRSQSKKTLADMEALLEREVHQIERERQVHFEFDEPLTVDPAVCDPTLVEELKQAMAAVGQEPFVMASGGGHDAAVFQGAGIPSAMVFVRNRNGSHNPREAMEIDDLIAGTDIIYAFLTGRTP